MNQTGNILFLLFVVLLCSSDGCNENADMAEKISERQITNSKDSIIQVFGTDFPGEMILRDFELTAAQKLTDFADYLKIVSDTSLDKTFRIQAAGMAKKLFVSPESGISGWNKFGTEKTLTTLNQLVDNRLSTGLNYWIKPVQIETKKPLTQTADSAYSGIISFLGEKISFDQQIPSKIFPGILFVDVFLSKRIKLFGTERLPVWEVTLGNISPESKK